VGSLSIQPKSRKSRTRSEETVFHVSVGSVESQWSYIPLFIHESAVQHSDKQCLGICDAFNNSIQRFT